MTDHAQTPGTVPAAVPGALFKSLCAELDRASRCGKVWVMNLDSYKQVRRESGYNPDGEQDEDKWVPSAGDTMLGLRVLVRDDGGEPHIEWLTIKELMAHDQSAAR